MERIIYAIERFFSTTYRLSVKYRGDGFVRHFEDESRRFLLGMAMDSQNAEYWTLYKRGPFFLHEREVKSGNGKGGSQ